MDLVTIAAAAAIFATVLGALATVITAIAHLVAAIRRRYPDPPPGGDACA